MIKFTNLTKAFGDHTVLNDISVQIYEGQTTVIVGSSGSGKSTLLRCINLLEIPQKGELELGGQRLNFANKISQKELLSFRRHTGMVFQSFNLFPHLTVLQNVIEGPTQVLGIDKQSATNKARELLKIRSDSTRKKTPTQIGSRAANANERRSRELLRWILRFCY